MNKNKVLIIAEAGVNHNGDMERARQLIDVAVEAGADIVKFQSFVADKLASKDAPKAKYQIENADQGAGESQYDMLKRLELSEDDHRMLIAYCKEKGIEFLSTPFDVDGVHMLVDKFGLNRIKLGSSELTNAPILLAAAQTGHEVIFSTGMGALDEIRTALEVLAFGYLNSHAPKSQDDFKGILESPAAKEALLKNVTILHCSTAYPTPYEDVNLKAMQTIFDEFGIRVGYSDHTLGNDVSLAAVAMGARIIEKHFTLDCSLPGPDHKASSEPAALKALVQNIRRLEAAMANGLENPLESDAFKAMIENMDHVNAAMGDGKKAPRGAEMDNYEMARKSLVAARDIAEGEVFTPENVTIKRPGDSLAPINYWDVMGTKATRAYKADQRLQS